MKINIPEVLIHLRHRVVQEKGTGIKGMLNPEAIAMRTAGSIFRSERRFRAAQRLGRMAANTLAHDDGAGQQWLTFLPGYAGGWTQARDLRALPKQTFREWFEQRGKATAKPITKNSTWVSE